MLLLQFKGRIKNRKIYEEFAEDVVNELFPREFKRDIVVGIQFKNVVEDGLFGQAIENDDDEYLVEVGKVVNEHQKLRAVEPREIAATIAHELIHIKQYIRRELSQGGTFWKGQKIPVGPRGGTIRYRDQPWEKEAFKREKEFTELYWDE
jgi:hypothetical protein